MYSYTILGLRPIEGIKARKELVICCTKAWCLPGPPFTHPLDTCVVRREVINDEFHHSGWSSR
jgi:hypothetical protein